MFNNYKIIVFFAVVFIKSAESSTRAQEVSSLTDLLVYFVGEDGKRELLFEFLRPHYSDNGRDQKAFVFAFVEEIDRAMKKRGEKCQPARITIDGTRFDSERAKHYYNMLLKESPKIEVTLADLSKFLSQFIYKSRSGSTYKGSDRVLEFEAAGWDELTWEERVWLMFQALQRYEIDKLTFSVLNKLKGVEIGVCKLLYCHQTRLGCQKLPDHTFPNPGNVEYILSIYPKKKGSFSLDVSEFPKRLFSRIEYDFFGRFSALSYREEEGIIQISLDPCCGWELVDRNGDTVTSLVKEIRSEDSKFKIDFFKPERLKTYYEIQKEILGKLGLTGKMEPGQIRIGIDTPRGVEEITLEHGEIPFSYLRGEVDMVCMVTKNPDA